MDKKSKILLIVFVVILTFSVAYTFYKTVILQDFEIVETEEYAEEDFNYLDAGPIDNIDMNEFSNEDNFVDTASDKQDETLIEEDL